MFRIFSDAVYIRNYGTDTQDDNKFKTLAVNIDLVSVILPCDENFDRSDKLSVSLMTLTTGEMIMVPKSVEEVCKILCGAKI